MVDDVFTLTVEIDPDPSGEALPRRFRLGTHVIEAAEILDRWPGTGHLYVKLRGADGATYILRQDLDRGRWQLALFRDPRAAGLGKLSGASDAARPSSAGAPGQGG